MDATQPDAVDSLNGFTSIPLSDYTPAPGDAVWAPNLRGTTLLFLMPAVIIWAEGTLIGGLSRGDWWSTTVNGLGWPIFLVGLLLAEVITLRVGGRRRCLFTDEWLGVQGRRDIAIIRYELLRTMWVTGKRGIPVLQVWASPPEIHAVRTDGVPVALPKLLCFSKRSRRAFIDFVEVQAAGHGLPIQDKPASSMAYWEESP